MSTWDRTNRIELELAQARGRIVKLEDELLSMGLDLAHALGSVNRLVEERDTARRIAMRLEEENHLLIDARDVRLVPVWGTAT